MIREICKDEAFLAQKAELATPADLQVAADLLDTLIHHKEGCVGLAANMIGVNKRIIAFDNDGSYMVMFNPQIIKKRNLTILRKVAFLSAEFGQPSAGNPLRFPGRTKSFSSV